MATDDTAVSRPFRLNFSDLPRPPRRTQTVTAPLPRAIPPVKPVAVAATSVKKKRAPRKAAAAVSDNAGSVVE